MVLEDFLDGFFYIVLVDGVVYFDELIYLECVVDVFGFIELEFGWIKLCNMGFDDFDLYLIFGVDL